jgi:hypothetical protein
MRQVKWQQSIELLPPGPVRNQGFLIGEKVKQIRSSSSAELPASKSESNQ